MASGSKSPGVKRASAFEMLERVTKLAEKDSPQTCYAMPAWWILEIASMLYGKPVA